MTLLVASIVGIQKKLAHFHFTPHLKPLSMVDNLKMLGQERVISLPTIYMRSSFSKSLTNYSFIKNAQ
jgi:hypothetical protein